MSWERWFSRWRPTRWACVAAVLVSMYVQTLGAFYYRSDDFNFRPNNIDTRTSRLWDISDGQIARE